MFSIWQLTPGAGGKVNTMTTVTEDHVGVVAVEFLWMEKVQLPQSIMDHGQGYGAGASGSSTINHGGSGLQGVILLETIST